MFRCFGRSNAGSLSRRIDHMFCMNCINQYMEKHDSCPVCLTPLDKQSFQLSKFAQRQLGRIRIKCLYAANGCPWQGILSDKHSDECNYKSCLCPNAENGCAETLSKANMDQHLETCPFSIIQCPNNMPLCQPFLRKDMSKHENECQSYTCPYASEGCTFIGTLYQANIHCESYCGRLHKRVEELENECKHLNKLINDYTLGLNLKLPSTPETSMQEDQQQQQQQQQQQFMPTTSSINNNINTTPKLDQVDTAMTEINLFSQMFNNDPFNVLDLPTTTATTTTNTAISTIANTNAITTLDTSNNQKEMMNLSACLPELSFLDPINFDSLLDTEDDEPLSFMSAPTATTVPKRTVNGKRIRYSKNPRLAHNALRWARQRTASTTATTLTTTTAVVPYSVNPTNDAILHNLDIAKQKASQQNFKSLEDVTKFLNTNDPPASSSSSSPQPQQQQKKKTSPSSPEVSNTVSSPPSTSAPKRKPMFILASSYLSNYNNSNESGDK
ncbi:hypothetical protein K501DRAFT_260010 [Backusella circina FSU 941]|nr:hypothetical protein K501DRAFT_260010 [Backusella circina FSU 941]